MLQPFTGKMGVKRKYLVFSQKVTFSNLSEMKVVEFTFSETDLFQLYDVK